MYAKTRTSGKRAIRPPRQTKKNVKDRGINDTINWSTDEGILSHRGGFNAAGLQPADEKTRPL